MTIKCISLNMWNGGNLFPKIIPFLKQHDADILLLQEVYNSDDEGLVENYRTLRVLRDKLNYPHDAFAPAMLDRLLVGKIDGGNAVLSKYPIVSNEIHFFNEPYGERDAYDKRQNPTAPRILQHVVIDASLILNVYNVHGVWDLDGDNYSEKRRRMSEVIIEQVKDKQNVILAGDTNAKPTNPAMRNIERYLVAVFGPEIKTTYNMKRKDNPGYATAACDLMYVSKGLKIVDKAVPDVDISDHLPLVVTLEIPG